MTKLLDVVYSLLQRVANGESLEDSQDEILEWLADSGINTQDAQLALNMAIRIQNRMAHGDSPSLGVWSERIFMDMERMRLSPDALGYLEEQRTRGVINSVMRDEIVSRALMTDIPEIDKDVCEGLLFGLLEEQEGWGMEESDGPPTLH